MSASPKPAGWAAKMRLKCDVEASRIGRIFAVTSLNFIKDVPLQFIEGYKTSKKIYFIPKIPIVSNRNTRIDEESTTTTSRANSSCSNRDSIISISNSNISEDEEELNTRTIETNTKSLIINNYIIEETNRNKDFRESNPLEQNKKLLNSFITKSNIYKYLENKNRNILVSLIYNNEYNSTLNSNNVEESKEKIIEIDISLDYSKIKELVINLLIEIDSKINNTRLLLRQLLKNDNNNKNIKNFKDFIPLESKYTKETYYSVFSKLVVFILKVFYILSKFKNTTNSLELEYLSTINTLRLERSIKRILNSIVNTNLDLLDVEENRIEFNSKLINLFIELLKDINYFSFKEDTTLKNIVIAYFYINCLDKHTKEIKPIDYIGKITSIIIYNSRLITLGYFYTKELKEEIDRKEISKEIEEFRLHGPLYRTPFYPNLPNSAGSRSGDLSERVAFRFYHYWWRLGTRAFQEVHRPHHRLPSVSAVAPWNASRSTAFPASPVVFYTCTERTTSS